MAEFPDSRYQMDPNLPVGYLADTSVYQAFTEPAETEIKFGAPLAYNATSTAVVVAAAGAKIIGIARAFQGLKNSFATTTASETAGSFLPKEPVTVVTNGSIVVPVSVDVNKGQKAAVTADGTFGVATDDTTAVGTFRSNGNAGGTAVLHINI